MPKPTPCHRRAILCTLFLGAIFPSIAQTFIIRHDLQKDSTTVYKLDKHQDTTKVKQVSLKRPGRLVLQVENFNPFYWNAKVTTFQTPAEEQSSYVQIFKALSKTVGVDFTLPGVPRGSFNHQAYAELKSLYAKASEVKFVEMELAALKMSRYKTEQEIKSEAQANVENLIGQKRLDAHDVLTIGSGLDKKLKDLSDSLSIAPLQFSFQNELLGVRDLYTEIMNTSYKFSYTVTGKTDVTDLKLDVFPKMDTSSKDTLTKYFSVRARPYMRFRSSAGIAFTYFQEKNTSYYIEPDTTIGKGKGDLFTPVLSFLIHFYNQRTDNFKWGGSFGFGIPLLGEKKDINFFLGLCALLGRNEPVIISAGVVGAKVDRITNGWHVGQKAPDLDFEVPTTSQFRAGGFVSLSFNLNTISSKTN